MHYFSHISATYSHKNKLEQAIYELLKENDRLIIPEADIIKFQGKITDRIEELNKEFPRCTPVAPYFSRISKNEPDYYLSPQSICIFILRATKN